MNSFQDSVAKLKAAGCRVNVTHTRCVKLPNGNILKNISPCKGDVILPHGGRTIVSVLTPDGDSYENFATCGAKDPYNKRIGREIAMGRLMKSDKRYILGSVSSQATTR